VRGLRTAYLPDRGTCRVRETVPRSGDALPPGGGRERKGKRVPWSGQRCRRPSSEQPVTRSDRPRWPDCGAEGFEAPRVRAPQGVRGGRPRVRGPQQPPPGILARLQIPAPESRGVPPLGKSICWRGCREGGFQGGELRRGRAGTGCALAFGTVDLCPDHADRVRAGRVRRTAPRRPALSVRTGRWCERGEPSAARLPVMRWLRAGGGLRQGGEADRPAPACGDTPRPVAVNVRVTACCPGGPYRIRLPACGVVVGTVAGVRARDTVQGRRILLFME
jgi:hypothetical protein